MRSYLPLYQRECSLSEDGSIGSATNLEGRLAHFNLALVEARAKLKSNSLASGTIDERKAERPWTAIVTGGTSKGAHAQLDGGPTWQIQCAARSPDALTEESP